VSTTSSRRADPLPQRLLEQLRSLPEPRGYLVALSGGLDSMVLLHLMAALRSNLPAPLRAVHIHHGLHPDADLWSRHCRERCAALSVPLTVCRVEVAAGPRRSLEAAAREARYGAIGEILGEGEMLLLAHHGDDQVETFLLQLLRGAGVEGLAAMPPVRAWRRGWMARPLLGENRAGLRRWAEAQGIAWMEDPGNADRRMARNYLRHEVLPLLQRRWPGLEATVGRSARHCAEAAQLLGELAVLDLEKAGESHPWRLGLEALMRLSPARQRNLLRHWMRRNGVTPPPADVLARVLRELPGARRDAAPEVHWKGGALRRYRDRLYLFPGPLPPAPEKRVLHWRGDAPLRLPGGLGELRLEGARPAWFPEAGVEVRFRHQGFRCRPAGREGSRSFKRLCQELGIPPWLRPRLPLVVVRGQLAAVADRVLCHPFGGGGESPFRWVRDPWLY